MGMPTASIAQNPTNSAPMSQSGGKGGGKGLSGLKGMESTFLPSQPPAQQAGQFPVDQGARSNLQPPSMPQGSIGKGGMGNAPTPDQNPASNMTLSATSGQPTMGQPNPYPNTTGSWDNSATQQPPAQMSGGKGKGA